MNTTNGSGPLPPQLARALSFSGEITASVTHELNNVLSTIEQITGLLEDLAVTDLALQAGLADRLGDIANRVVAQTSRGTALVKHLNGFAHLSDEAVAECDLAELSRRMVILTERFARMRKVQLTTAGLDEAIVIKAGPFLTAERIYRGIRRALQIAAPSQTIEFTLSRADDGGVVTIIARCGDDAPAAIGAPRTAWTEETPGDGTVKISLALHGDS